jgi:hypothetical protein
MMFAAFLHATFRRFGGGMDALATADDPSPGRIGTLDQAVEHVVDETSPRLRAVPGYARRLREPVLAALRTVDQMVEAMPDALSCCRATYRSDPRVNGFFADYSGLQAVFSQSGDVRGLFEDDARAEHCFALLCMHRDDARHLGAATDVDALRAGNPRAGMSFTDHQLVSPGLDEAGARCALKCCIFSNLIARIRMGSADTQTRSRELEHRAQAWRARLRRAALGSPAYAALRHEVESIETELHTPALRLATVGDHFRYVADALSKPDKLISSRSCSIFVDRRGICQDGSDTDGARELPLSEIQVAGRRPRVACLVSFPRAELLPERDFVREASLFLAA